MTKQSAKKPPFILRKSQFMYSKPQRKRNTLQSSRPFHCAFFDDDACKVPCKSKPQHFHFGCLNIIILEGSRAWVRGLHAARSY